MTRRKRDANSANENGGTLVEQAMALVRRDIVTGHFAPNDRLGVHALAERYEIGTTPVREALTRLCTTGFVVAIEQKGFRVSDLNRADLEDLVHTREIVETAALRMAMRNGDDQWEAGIIAALHRLAKFTAGHGPRAFEAAPADYDEIHKAFHTALISACGSPRLVRLYEGLYDQTFRYRSFLMSKDVRLRTVGHEHRTIAELAIKRDAEAACAALASHLRSLLDI